MRLDFNDEKLGEGYYPIVTHRVKGMVPLTPSGVSIAPTVVKVGDFYSEVKWYTLRRAVLGFIGWITAKGIL